MKTDWTMDPDTECCWLEYTAHRKVRACPPVDRRDVPATGLRGKTLAAYQMQGKFAVQFRAEFYAGRHDVAALRWSTELPP